MHFLPVRSVPLASELPPGALADVLRGAVGSLPDASFAGAVLADRFVITRMKEFRSTHMPLLRGRLSAVSGGGTSVRLRLRPPRVVVWFMAIWIGFLALAAALVVAAHAVRPDRSLWLLLAPAGLAAVSWHVMVSVFAADARWAVEHLLERVPALRPVEAPRGGT